MTTAIQHPSFRGELQKTLEDVTVSQWTRDQKIELVKLARDFYERTLDEGQLPEAEAARLAFRSAFALQTGRRDILLTEMDRAKKFQTVWLPCQRNMSGQLKKLGIDPSHPVYSKAMTLLASKVRQKMPQLERAQEILVGEVMKSVSAHYTRCHESLARHFEDDMTLEMKAKAVDFLTRLTPLDSTPDDIDIKRSLYVGRHYTPRITVQAQQPSDGQSAPL